MFYEIIGWIGTILILAAYFLISGNLVSGQSLIYQTMNMTGALFMGISVFKKSAWASFGLQIAWLAIGAITIVNILF